MTIGAGVGMEMWSADKVCPQGRVSGRCRKGLNSPGSDGQKSLQSQLWVIDMFENVPSKDNT
jgi:hypothetical protein